MKTYSISFARSLEMTHEHPERTAKKVVGWDILYRVWPSRGAMARSIRMQAQRAPKQTDWTPVVPLQDGEGY